ncbi:MAG: DUF1517 domain-containing protein [Myxococcota bacterium]
MRVLAIALLLLSAPATAQFSGSSFGGSRGFGGGGSSSSSWGGGSSSSSSWGGSSSSYHDDSARQAREAEERRRQAEERARRAAEERARREAERRRIEEERRRQLAFDRSLPPDERARLERFVSISTPIEEAPAWRDPRRFEAPEEQVETPTPSPQLAPVYAASSSPAYGPDWINGGLCMGPAFLLFAVVGLLLQRRRALVVSTPGAAPRPPQRRASKRGRGSCELRRISIAFDHTARRKLQQTLEAVGTRHNVQSEHGMHAAAQEVASILASSLQSARFAMWESRLAWPNDAEERFFAMASDLESRYRYDPARGDRGPDRSPRPEEGEGFVVVSLVLGSTRRMPELPAHFDLSALSDALRGSLSISARELVAVKVIWSPAMDHDRMSSAELVGVYPELLPFTAGLGRVACTHCRAIYAGELERCPACGAPR